MIMVLGFGAATLYPYAVPAVPTLYPRCTHAVPTLYPRCTHAVPTLYPRCTHAVPTLAVPPRCTRTGRLFLTGLKLSFRV